MHAYYYDADRAARTDRATLYLHLGLLSGLDDEAARPRRQWEDLLMKTAGLPTRRADRGEAHNCRTCLLKISSIAV